MDFRDEVDGLFAHGPKERAAARCEVAAPIGYRAVEAEEKVETVEAAGGWWSAFIGGVVLTPVHVLLFWIPLAEGPLIVQVVAHLLSYQRNLPAGSVVNLYPKSADMRSTYFLPIDTGRLQEVSKLFKAFKVPLLLVEVRNGLNFLSFAVLTIPVLPNVSIS